MYVKKQRSGFSMITAITMIVLMSTVALFVSSLSGKMLQETTAQYQQEQAILLANSYTEYAIMAVTANNRTVNCLQTINGTFGTAPNSYRARIQISYIGTNLEIGNCPATRQLSTLSVSNRAPLSIIIDAYIDYNDVNSGVPCTYHRRSIQKI